MSYSFGPPLSLTIKFDLASTVLLPQFFALLVDRRLIDGTKYFRVLNLIF